MNWSTFHGESERLASAAHEALRKGDADGAADLFAKAAEAEGQALGSLGSDKPRTLGVTAVSAVALWYKAGRLEQAEQAAYQALAMGHQPKFAIEQLRTLLQSIWNEAAKRAAGVQFAPGQVLVSVKGGEVVTGGAPLDLILEKVQIVQSLFYRTAEYLKDLPLRKKGPPSRELQERCRPWLFQTVAGSYQFAVAIQQPRQTDLFRKADPEPKVLTEAFLAILRASSEDPDAGLKAIVAKEDYRNTFLKMTRNLAPTGKLFERMEVRSAAELHPVVLVPASRALISEALRGPRRPSSPGNADEFEISGVLRALDLNDDWLELATDGHDQKVVGVGDTVDDLIGPMVNHNVVVRVRRGSRNRLSFIDIEPEE